MKFLCPPAEHGSNLSTTAKCPRASSFTAPILTMMLCFLFAVTTNAATYIGTNTGAIPDGPGNALSCGTPRDVQFLVTSFTGGFGSGSVSFTMTPRHTWVGDLRVWLIAPDATTHLLFSGVGRNEASAGDYGDNSNLNGTYTFNDLATANLWQAAASGASTNHNITNTSYRTQGSFPFANDDPGPAFTSLNAAFAPMDPANINGTWTLRFVDCASSDTGTVSAASLTINPTLAGDVVLGGRILTKSGAGLKGAMVTISGGDLAAPRTVTTSTFGHYIFDDLNAGQTYIVSVAARRYTFQTPAMAVSLEEDLAEVNFVANQ